MNRKDSWRYLGQDRVAPPRNKLLLTAACIIMGFGICYAAKAADLSDIASLSLNNCHDRLLIDKRDNPTVAIRNYHRCSAARDIEITLEDATLWYITQPDHERYHEFVYLQNIWNNDIGILMGPFVGLQRQQAIAILDSSVARGLDRGGRKDLVDKWAASHDLAILSSTEPPKEADKTISTGSPTPASTTAIPPSSKPQPSPARVAAAPRLKPPRQRTRHGLARRTFPARSYFDNRAPIEQTYRVSSPTPGFDRPPPENGAHETAAAPYGWQPANGAESGRPAAQQPPVSSFAQPQPVQQASQQQPQYRTIPQQIAKNFQTVGQLVDENVRTVFYTFFGFPSR